MDPLFGLITQTYVDGHHGPHPTQETARLRFYVKLTDGQLRILAAIILRGSSADLPPELS